MKKSVMSTSKPNRVYENILEAIGNTPLVHLGKIEGDRICLTVRQSRILQSGRIDKRPYRRQHHRRCRAKRPIKARRHSR